MIEEGSQILSEKSDVTLLPLHYQQQLKGPVTSPAQEQKDIQRSSQLRGGYVGVIVSYDANRREFEVHGTPIPGRNRLTLSYDTIKTSSIGDLWCLRPVIPKNE